MDRNDHNEPAERVVLVYPTPSQLFFIIAGAVTIGVLLAEREWLEANPPFHLHFTPTSASWMNQVETWFSILQRKTIRRGVFRSVGSLQSAVHRFIDAWNDHKKPFAWVRTSDEILAKAIPKAISAGLH